MSLTSRDFMKLFGVSAASLYLTRCQLLTTLPATSSSARERLRLSWLKFNKLAQKTSNGRNKENDLGQQMIVEHRAALDELVAAGEISASVADLVQEAYEAAVFHVWRSNVPITCYAPVIVDYAPSSANVLVKQSEVLNQIAAQGTVDPATLAKAQSALEHDMAFYALSDADVQALYDQLIKNSQEAGQPIPSFEALQLELTPDAQAAAQFILELLTGK